MTATVPALQSTTSPASSEAEAMTDLTVEISRSCVQLLLHLYITTSHTDMQTNTLCPNIRDIDMLSFYCAEKGILCDMR